MKNSSIVALWLSANKLADIPFYAKFGKISINGNIGIIERLGKMIGS